MNSLAFIYKKSFENKLKKAVRRPVTYIAGVCITAYIIMIGAAFVNMARDFAADSPQRAATVLSVLMFYIVPANIISYVKRKGLLFRKSEVHFVFSAPENPKTVIIYAGLKQLIMQAFIGIFICVIAFFGCGLPFWKAAVFFGYFVVLEMILEGSLMIICYGNELLPKSFFKIMTTVMYIMMAVFAGTAVIYLYIHGVSMQAAGQFLKLPGIQLLPIFGWEIAIIHLIFVGPTTVNMTASAFLVLFTLAMFVCAWKAPCTGEYYEDAATFADDFEEKRRRSRKGEVIFSFNTDKKKRYVRQVSSDYDGTYAKAIYYRQLLEYKKKRFFIFGWTTVFFLAAGVAIAVVCSADMIVTAPARIFVIPGVMAYMTFLMSGYATKWSKELENPYTYLIPDSNFKKLWNATKIEHIRAFVDGCLITMPGMFVLRISPAIAILTILFYVTLNANKLYTGMLSDALLGNRLGTTGKTILRMFMQGITLTISVIAAIVGFFFSTELGFVVMITVTAVLTLAGAFGASVSFDRMEKLD